ncbi:MAG: hypothetical protein N3B16_03855 [Candidatus Aminicenantes bacterium]|nr:hypothetical protein [Candidatus Aminicenantes bacterium]
MPVKIKTYSIKERLSKVKVDQFGSPFSPENSFNFFVHSWPDILAAKQFKELVESIKQASFSQKPIILGMGAHVIKVGLNPIIIDLMERGLITALALNGAGIIHDFEIAYCGQTSEDVATQIETGSFGMAWETAEFLNQAIKKGAEKDQGLGEAVAEMIATSDFPYKNCSLLATAFRLKVPATVHVAIGTDVIHMHPQASGEAIGKTSLRDFYLFCSLVEKLEGGGVYLNVGSAVILPEVFLKAVSYVRNRGSKLENLTTAVFDFFRHYRPEQNVIKRIVGEKGKGYYFLGHHEIMIPLLAACLKS